MQYSPTPLPDPSEALRLEAVTTCVGFDDLLDHTLTMNHPHLDTMIVVTTHEDRRTHAVAKKHGAMCVKTDLFTKNNRRLNKGAAINAGFAYFQYRGWRLHIDSDIILPDNFRRILFNHITLDTNTLYGADRVDVIGLKELHAARKHPQHSHGVFIHAGRPHSHRFLDTLHGYLPIGYFQLWHASCHKDYPYSSGTAAHDDTMFAALWPRTRRALLPGVIVYHLIPRATTLGENWEGRRHPRLDK
jgi:hypothetical protein